jgi:hypothetical protein
VKGTLEGNITGELGVLSILRKLSYSCIKYRDSIVWVRGYWQG